MKRSLFSKGLCFALAIGVLGIAGGVVGSSAATAVEAATTYVDDFTHSVIPVTSNSYTEWTYSSSNSKISYAGKTARNNYSGTYSIQFSSGSDRGMITTANPSNLKLTNIEIVWRSGNTNNRTLTFYGKTEAYSGTSDLYSSDAATLGTSIGSISTSGSTTSLAVTQGYTHLGIKSSAAVYVSNIILTWAPAEIKLSDPDYNGSTLKGSAFSAKDFTFTVDDGTTQSTVDGTTEGVTIATDKDFANTVSDGNTDVFANEGTVNLYYKYNDVVCTEPLAVTITATAVNVEGVTLDQTSATAFVGTPVTLVATVAPENATNKAVTWSSSNTSVATVAEGVVTPVSAGTATITVTTVDQSKTASCVVTVSGITTYSYTFSSKVFEANETKTLNGVAWTLAGSYNGSGYWGSDGTKGQQFGSGSGYYTSMTLSTNGIGGIIKSVKVNTSGSSDINATLSVIVGGVAFGSQISLTSTATEYTFDGTGAGEIVLSFANSSSKAMYVKSIVVEYGSYSSVTGVTISPETVADLETGNTVTLSATVAPDTANPNVTWSSSNSSVATVDATGVVTGVGAGTATITATAVGTVAEGGSGTATKIINVVAPAKTLSEITINEYPAKTSYVMFEAISYEGITVNAIYSDASSEVVGKDALTFSPAEGTIVTSEDVATGSISAKVTYTTNTGSKELTLTLTVGEATTVFTKVTSLEELEIGATYTFGYQADGSSQVIPAGAFDTNRFGIGTAVYTDGTYFLDNDSIIDFTLAPGSASGKYALWYDDPSATATSDDSGYIAQQAAGETDVEIESAFDTGDLNFAFNSDGTVTITSLGTRHLGYNSQSSRFAFYADTYPDVCLYKRYAPSNSAYDTAHSWANNFLTATISYCEDGTIEANWDSILTEYAVPTDTLAKDFLVRGWANADASAGLVEQALARYDYIVDHHASLKDDLGRRSTNALNARNHSDDGENTAMIAMASILGIGLGTGAVVILARKKKRVR